MMTRAMLIRPMREADVGAVARTEALAYEFPWTQGIFRDCLRVGYRCDVLESAAGEIAGYCIMSCALDEAHILNLCVAAGFRRQGLGRMLLHHLLRQARSVGCRRVFLEVRPSNEAALSLYEHEGFERLGVRRDYYRAAAGREDAIVLARVWRKTARVAGMG